MKDDESHSVEQLKIHTTVEERSYQLTRNRNLPLQCTECDICEYKTNKNARTSKDLQES